MNDSTAPYGGIAGDNTGTTAPDMIVIGGGLAGLTAATVAAREGAAVTLVDARSELGGRARSEDRHGFTVNQGPHALYKGGDAFRILRTLGVRVDGAFPPFTGAALADGGELLPARRPSTMGWGATRALMAALRGGAPGKVTPGTSVAEWLDANTGDRHDRDRVEAFIRVTSYLGDTTTTDAAAAFAQMRRGMKGVLYLHGGWRTLIEGLRQAAASAGVDIVTNRKATAVRRNDGGTLDVTIGEEATRCRSVVIATGGAGHAASLLDGASPSLAARAASAKPATAACLDVSLHRLPNPKRLAVLGADRPTYLIVHSASARLAPESGGELIHAMRYEPDLDPEIDPRAELESLLDLAQPGWRYELIDARFSPRLVVMHDRPQPGVEPPDVAVPEVGGVFVAGDWLTGNGLLADAAIGSAERAARGALRHLAALEGAGRRSPIALATGHAP